MAKQNMQLTRLARMGSSCVVAAMASACATLPSIGPAERLYTGRFSAAISNNQKTESLSGRFSFAVQPTGTTLDLISPIGNTLARLQTSARQATLTAPRPDGSLATWTGQSPESLSESVLGWTLPASNLPYWISGQPAPGRPAQVLPVTGLPTRIDQDGWTVDIEQRFDKTQTPRRLSIESTTTAPVAHAIRLRLVLDPTTLAANHQGCSDPP